MESDRTRTWDNIVARITGEYTQLAEAEQQVIDHVLDRIEAVQRDLNRLFHDADGETICFDCQGDCCAKGHNHMTLANVLGFVRKGESPPQPDFARTCPFLGPTGCVLDVTRRPYNCVTFICDRIEDALSSEQKESFYTLDRRLRELYLDLTGRYQGAGMTGLLIQEARYPGQPFLTVSDTAENERTEA